MTSPPGAGAWRPISEYHPEMGRVVVWLQWPAYNRSAGSMESEGQWQPAYLMSLNDGAVWVEAKDCTPIETTGRRVTHFINPSSPFLTRVERISRALMPEKS